MANTYSKIYIQVVFAVKGRENLISKIWKEELYRYITGIIKNKDQKLIAINGMPDHIHILVGLKPSKSISDLVRDIKANASRFINEKKWVDGKFEWQNGFGAFSYSQTEIGNVVAYIQNQEAHHYKKTFKEEYLELLENFGIDFKEEFIFEEV